MKLWLDLQGAQTESRFRGIGRYSFGFARALAARAGAHDIGIVLNGAFGSTIESLRAAFADHVPADRIVVFDLPGAVAESDPRNKSRTGIAESMREAFIAGMAPDVVHVSSMVEGWLDDGVTSIGAFDDTLVTAATLYDLIPLLRPDEYLVDGRYRAFYMRKLEHFKRAKLLFAISDSARQEAIDAIGVSAENIVSIGCGIDPVFSSAALHTDVDTLRRRFGITKSFVLYTGGFDARKNVPRLLAAFGQIPDSIRRHYLLVVGGRIGATEREALIAHARICRVPVDALKFTGEIDDSVLAALYRQASLFVFPSLHEGFGLPVAEAMKSGAPVIASRTSSMPEVLGRADALFNPLVIDDIAQLMVKALTVEQFRNDLSRHGMERARLFTWDACAARALPAFEALHRGTGRASRRESASTSTRLRLAYVSPMPPQRTGIADYSAGLLPELAHSYDIEVVTDQDSCDEQCKAGNLPLRSIAWFEQHASEFDRILYHVGNSPFHRRLIEVAKVHPGTVVMHDFYLTGLMRWMEEHGGDATALRRALYAAHGYKALVQATTEGREVACSTYPGSLEVFEAAGGVIMHSQHAAALVQHWYGPDAARDVAVVPLYASREASAGRAALRAKLQIPEDAFVVCSFGFLAPTKLNLRLLAAWRAAKLDVDDSAWLIFVGENDGGEYGRRVLATVAASAGATRIRVTGYASEEVFGEYLATADIAVQLRAMSRGESSWALLRCLANGLPTIANAHGSAAEYPDGVVIRLPDAFTDEELGSALADLRSAPDSRNRMRDAALAYVADAHAPVLVAAKYSEAIERFASINARIREHQLISAVAAMTAADVADDDLARIAQAIARQRPTCGPRQLLVDVSVIARTDLRSGIERVVRGVLMELLRNPPTGFRVEPVRDDGFGRYVYARQHALRWLELPESLLPDELVEVQRGDYFLGLDWYADGIPQVAAQLIDWRNHGVRIHFVVYDLLPVLMPETFPPSSLPLVRAWLATIMRIADGLICISRSVADELNAWVVASPPVRASVLEIGHFRLGSTFSETLPTRGIAAEARQALEGTAGIPVFLMVGTVEPRKAHRQVLAAFETLWESGLDVRLVIVGREGWMMEAVATLLRSHPEHGRRLFWFTDVSDEMLDQLYSASAALIAASLGEGFGLPIVEAARRGLPVIVRDIPVFREVAGDNAHYFAGNTPGDLVSALRTWIDGQRTGDVPDSAGIEVIDWTQSTVDLTNVMLEGSWYRRWSPHVADVAGATTA